MTSTIVAGGLPLAFSSEDEQTARVIADAVDATLRLATDSWGLAPPKDCRLYVMTSWRGFFFESAPAAWKVLLAVGYPLWCGRARRVWLLSAGWTPRYSRRVAIGIKPPRLVQGSDRSVGARLFIEEPDPTAKLRHVTCHELIHAASAHLKLPAWLNEGLAAVSVDRFMGQPTIREDSLDLLEQAEPKAAPPSYRAMARLRGEALAYHAVRGYWIVRLLEETHPSFVRSLLNVRLPHTAIERRVAERLGLQSGLWREIDDIVTRHFRRPGSASS